VTINLDANQQVGSVSYSPDDSEALVIMGSASGNKIELVNFNDASIKIAE